LFGLYKPLRKPQGSYIENRSLSVRSRFIAT